MERTVALKLDSLDIKYIRQHRIEWLRNKSPMPLDFFIPEFNTAIECQGDQHFRSYEMLGGDSALKELQTRDLLKYNLCKENGIRMLYLVPRESFIQGLPMYTKSNTFTSIEKLVDVLFEPKTIKLNDKDLREMIITTIGKILNQ